ncbi:MAG TPA: glycosyltransferase [Stellaceae bacterium]|nr:glycosyltransferase [Stellaceae bacterium]
MLPHVVVTRFGTGVYRQSWYDSAIGLFAAVTLPSLRAQRFERFIWLIVVDRAMPEAARLRLEALLDDDRFHLVPIDLEHLPTVRYGSAQHIWDCCLNYLFARRLVTNPFDYIATAMIDADDAWHIDTLRIVDDRFCAALPEVLRVEERTPGFLKHTSGMVLNAPRGLQWYAQADIVVPSELRFQSMSVFVLARLSSGIASHSSRHRAWDNYSRVLDFPVEDIFPDRPMWVYARHDRAEQPWSTAGSVSDLAAAEELRGNFGIDFEKVASWRAEREGEGVPNDGRPGAYPPYPLGVQIDTYFRITALNQQISALSERLRDAIDVAEITGIEVLLRQQRDLREQLVTTLTDQGLNFFR